MLQLEEGSGKAVDVDEDEEAGNAAKRKMCLIF